MLTFSIRRLFPPLQPRRLLHFTMAQSHTTPTRPRRSTRQVKTEDNTLVKLEETEHDSLPPKSKKRSSTAANKPAKRVKTEPPSPSKDIKPTTKDGQDAKDTKVDKASALQAKKLKSYTAFASSSPFPSFPQPTPEACRLAHRILADLHGERKQPETVTAPINSSGCGSSPSVLDALVRTILSQNTSDSNSSRAKRSMDDIYGGSDSWEAIIAGGQPKLQSAIQSGGLAVVKSKVIISVLEQVHAQYGVYSLDHLFNSTSDEAMQQLLSFKGVGPKTASCVLMFCLRRASFAVDTHVYRLTGQLGWRPTGASREEAQAHLDATIPDDEKYALHVLLIAHGKRCPECKAGGKSLGKCELRKAFRKGALKGEAGEEMKLETLDTIKKEAETE